MLEILPQIIWYSLLAGAIYALIAIGLTLIFGILGFINFAHGDMAMLGAYLFFALSIFLKIPYWASFIIVIPAAALIGIVIEKLTFKPVRKSPPVTPLVISIGVGAVIQAIVLLLFGAEVRSYRQEGDLMTQTYSFFDNSLVITQSQIFLMVVTALLLGGLHLFLKYSKQGKAIRAVADNQDVASILGINIDTTVSLIFALGTVLAAIGGLLIANEQNLNVTMGISLGVKAFAAIVLGGVGNLLGAVVGAMVIGFSENFIVGFTPVPANFKDGIVFFLLIIVLFVKPGGILGAKREEDVRGK
ncbi:MAG TPA: branched-chain amino acid ABC transporter permease [Candidatus Gracilibacteria bacterium]|nr:branched-chain amino acid ABC transporter permease [Candidatus Gracilibacteria bacterium]